MKVLNNITAAQVSHLFYPDLFKHSVSSTVCTAQETLNYIMNSNFYETKQNIRKKIKLFGYFDDILKVAFVPMPQIK